MLQRVNTLSYAVMEMPNVFSVTLATLPWNTSDIPSSYPSEIFTGSTFLIDKDFPSLLNVPSKASDGPSILVEIVVDMHSFGVPGLNVTDPIIVSYFGCSMGSSH